MPLILSTFNLVSMDEEGMFPNSLKVVFMFQDTYPTPGCACGVATATIGRPPQPTLANMFQRLRETYHPKKENGESIPINMPTDGDIRGWCTQGVLMYNAALTTMERKIGEHIDAWGIFSQRMIEWISTRFPFVIFVMFGAEARKYGKFIDKNRHRVLETSHPSGRGYYAGFDKCDIFNEVNTILSDHKREPIAWERYAYAQI